MNETSTESGEETARVVRLAVVRDESRPPSEPTAEQRMWTHYAIERSKGRTPTGAELDQIAGTNNYGRKVLRRWREAGYRPPDVGPGKDMVTVSRQRRTPLDPPGLT